MSVLDRATSAIDSEVLPDLRQNLRLGQFVSGRDVDGVLRKGCRSAQALLQFQFCLARPEDQKLLGIPDQTNDFVVVAVKVLTVACLVFLLASAVGAA